MTKSAYSPTGYAWAVDVARHQLAETLPRRWRHVQGVVELALEIAPRYGADGDLLVSAAALHDIGWAPAFARTGFPALDGAPYLATLGAPRRLVDLTVNYLAAAVEADVRGRQKEMAAYPDERSAVRDALWYADARVGPDGERVSVDERFAEMRARYAGHPVVDAWLLEAEPAVRAAAKRAEAHIGSASPAS
jgi:hypothetical protein